MESTNTSYNDNGLLKIKIPGDEIFHTNATKSLIFKQIYNGNIIPDGKITDTPIGLSVNLKLHQQRLLYEMCKKEDIDHRVSSGINAFCLADNVGSGKSLDVLALITHRPSVLKLQPNKLSYKVRKSGDFNGFDIKETVYLKTNLIVVPHGIYNQWVGYIEKYTNLTWFGVSFVRDLNKININDIVGGKYNIVLVKSTRYTEFMNNIYIKYPYNTSIVDYNGEKNTKMLTELVSKLTALDGSCKDHQFDSNFINNMKEFKQYIEKSDLNDLASDISTLGKYRMYNIKQYRGPIFDRVFIDEANSIKIPGCLPAYGKVNWFITSSVDDLLKPFGYRDYSTSKILVNGIKGTGFIRNVFCENSSKSQSQFIQDMYLKNKDVFIKNSFKLPDPIENKVSCHTPEHLKILQGVAIPEVIKALNAGDYASAITSVGCNVSSQDDIVEAVLYNLKNDLEHKSHKLEENNNNMKTIITTIDNIKSSIANLNDSNYFDESVTGNYDMYYEELTACGITKSNLKKSIILYQGHIKDLNFKIESLKNRISDIHNKDCPICTSKVEGPCLTPCCKQVFCLACIAQAIHYSNKKECPLCRKSPFSLSDLTVINEQDSSTDIKKEELPSKLESLLKIIKDKPGGRFLVFSEFENTLKDIITGLIQESITHSKLSGSSGHVTNTINKYSANITQVLLLNAKHYGSGLNLQMTTDIIIFHRMANDLETQIIGRGQRPGRIGALNIHYLCYDNEI